MLSHRSVSTPVYGEALVNAPAPLAPPRTSVDKLEQEAGKDIMFVVEVLLAILGGYCSYLSLPKHSTHAVHGSLYRFGSDGSFYYFFLSLLVQTVLLLVRKYRVRSHKHHLFLIPRGVTHAGLLISGAMFFYTDLHGFVMLFFTFYNFMVISYSVSSLDYIENDYWRFHYTAPAITKGVPKPQSRKGDSKISLAVLLLLYCFMLFFAIMYSDSAEDNIVAAKVNTVLV